MLDKRTLNTLAIGLFVCILMVIIQPSSAHAREAQLLFSWDIVADVVADQGIKELRVYQDSSDNIVGTADPLSGTIKINTDIAECSNFWATYATDDRESERTDEVVGCIPGRGDPAPATKVVSVSGFKVTIELIRLNGSRTDLNPNV